MREGGSADQLLFFRGEEFLLPVTEREKVTRRSDSDPDSHLEYVTPLFRPSLAYVQTRRVEQLLLPLVFFRNARGVQGLRTPELLTFDERQSRFPRFLYRRLGQRRSCLPVTDWYVTLLALPSSGDSCVVIRSAASSFLW